MDRNHFAIGSALLAAAIFFMLALMRSLSAAAPRSFNVNGSYLDMWSSDEDLYGPISKSLIGQARVYQDQIQENNAVLQSRAAK
jgi:hypothetical protein